MMVSPIWKDTLYFSSARSPGSGEVLTSTVKRLSASVTVPAALVPVMVMVYCPALSLLKAQALSRFHRS